MNLFNCLCLRTIRVDLRPKNDPIRLIMFPPVEPQRSIMSPAVLEGKNAYRVLLSLSEQTSNERQYSWPSTNVYKYQIYNILAHENVQVQVVPKMFSQNFGKIVRQFLVFLMNHYTQFLVHVFTNVPPKKKMALYSTVVSRAIYVFTFKLNFVLLKEDESIRISCQVRVFSKVPWSMLELRK